MTTVINGSDNSASTPALTGTDTDTGVFFPSANNMALSTGGTERMRVNSSGNVGIGTTSTYGTNSKLSVSGSATAADTGIVLSDGATTTIGLALATPATGAVPYIFGNNNLAFGANGAERMRITSDGYLRMASGTGGIQFGGDTAAANALDDYEEGTFTPTALGASSAGTTTYTVQQGSYTKIGRQVTVSVRLDYSALTGTGELRLGGFPFTSSNDSMEYIGPIMTNNLNWIGGTTITTYVIPNSTQAVIFCSTDDNPWASQQCVNESAGIRFTATYFTS